MLMGCIIGVFIKSFLDFEKKVLIDMGLIVFGNENFWFSFFVEVCDLIFFFFLVLIISFLFIVFIFRFFGLKFLIFIFMWYFLFLFIVVVGDCELFWVLYLFVLDDDVMCEGGVE